MGTIVDSGEIRATEGKQTLFSAGQILGLAALVACLVLAAGKVGLLG